MHDRFLVSNSHYLRLKTQSKHTTNETPNYSTYSTNTIHVM